MGTSTAALKLVPALYSLGFVLVSALVARRLFGPGPGLLTAAYLALPPMMLALWSTKARGGYAELLFLGEAVLLLTLHASTSERKGALTGALGVTAGLAFWTNPLALVYLVPAAVYLVAALEGAVVRLIPPLVLGVVIGAAPGLMLERVDAFAAIASAAGTVGARALDMPRNVDMLLRVALPVMVGLGEPIAEGAFWEQDWPTRPASLGPIALAADALLLLGLAAYHRSVAELVDPRDESNPEPDLLVVAALTVLFALPFSQFAELVAEPRYALPLYATAPLYAGLLWRLHARGLAVMVLSLALPFALNAYSLLSANPRFFLPISASESTPQNRAELIQHLKREGLTEVYTDYWLAYPLAFEGEEQVIPAVMSGGPDRYAAYAERVRRSPRPAFVVVRDGREAAAFQERLQSSGARARTVRVAVYDVISDIDPLVSLLPDGKSG